MHITLQAASESLRSLDKLNERSFSIAIAYKIATLHDAIKRELVAFEKASQKKIAELGLDKALPEDADQKATDARRAAIQSYQVEAAELLASTQIEVPDVKLKLADLGDAPIAPAALVGLDFLIEE